MAVLFQRRLIEKDKYTLGGLKQIASFFFLIVHWSIAYYVILARFLIVVFYYHFFGPKLSFFLKIIIYVLLVFKYEIKKKS